MRLHGKTIAVVGGSAQIGSGSGTPVTSISAGATEPWGVAICKRLAAEGASIAVVDPDPHWVAFNCDAIEAAGGSSQGCVTDIADFDALNNLSQSWLRDGRKLDALVTCYLDIEWGSVEEADIAAFERVVLFNLVGPVKATKAFLPLLKRREDTSILHIGSVDGLFGAPRVPSYSTSKGGLVPLTHVMAYEFAKYGIRVNSIASCQTIEMPPPDSEGQSSAIGFRGFPGSSYLAQLNAATPLKRRGPLTDWAGAAVFLVSEDAAYVTGTVLVVDCGRTIITPGTQIVKDS
jgi:NAD(P)-dependent dehydrogenase (short-subunit alcohol dehydrogenase family)